jgi:hypothetical protein
MDVEAVSYMTCCVDRLHPKSVGSLALVKYDSYYLDESTILPFGHPSLLRSIRGRKLMLDAFFIFLSNLIITCFHTHLICGDFMIG